MFDDKLPAALVAFLFVSATAGLSSGQLLPMVRQRALPAAAPEQPRAVSSAEPAKPVDEQAVISTRSAKPPVMAPDQIRLHLRDGSVIAGKLSVDTIVVETEFGTLNVPVAKIKRFTPGLASCPELAAQITGLFEDLGSDDYQKREQAHKELLRFGLKIQKELERYANDDNAERKRHLAEIRKELEELAEDREEFEDEQAVGQPWIRGDTVVTTEFTIVGRIAQDAFTLTSKYGPLTVKLSDVRLADRSVEEKSELRKSLSVSGNNLVQRTFKSSGIRVEKGDRITVRADGQITMTPWGNNQFSTPEGGAYFGWYIPNEIPGGALVAKIGSKGSVFKVGSKCAFVAKSSGVLQFAIAMQHQYANQNYNYPGQYNVRVKVQPK